MFWEEEDSLVIDNFNLVNYIFNLNQSSFKLNNNISNGKGSK